ncbi:hypothetical protein GOV14_05575 [Candidatus Pacearchaeota archaeon]|nr:hypothetical protein [Candidatus Pacearchaeota archaeon]
MTKNISKSETHSNGQGLIIFTQGMKRRFLASSAQVPQNIATYLNNKGPDTELLLNDVQGYHNFDGDGYRPNTPIDEIGIKCGHIDLVAGTCEFDSMIYAPLLSRQKTKEISVRLGLVPFKYGLVGELKFPANHIPEDNGKLKYISNRLENQNFVPFYNPRQPLNLNRSNQTEAEYTSLFKDTPFESNIPSKILLNRTLHTVHSKALWAYHSKR